ncbi:MAG: HEAT repeat domain-containing protein [Spirochaetia bacterium]|nr:HEAT repeat domain-containing protein [Spirochaetia bacterium]
MDDWGSLGDIPIVIYGRNGWLIRVHSLTSLGVGAVGDLGRMKTSRSGFYWNEHSIGFFCHDSTVFCVRLQINKMILIELSSGYAYGEDESNIYGLHKTDKNEWEEIVEEARAEVRRMALSFLESDDKDERVTGAIVCGQEKLEESVPLLRKLLDDDAVDERHYPGRSVQVFSVREAALEALKLMGEDVKPVKIVNETPALLPNE